MVALQTSFTSVSLESTLVAQPKSPKDSQKTAPMAFTGLGSPSTMPRTVVQDHLCQTSFRAGPTLQPQAGCYNMVDNSPSRMSVQELAPVTKTAVLNPSDPHWVLSRSLLTDLLPPELAVIAEGSLLNTVLAVKKDYCCAHSGSL